MNFRAFNPDRIYDTFTEKLWNYVYERDNRLCQECGRAGEAEHHVKYKSKAGKHRANEIILLCTKCHMKEHDVKAKDEEIYLKRIADNERKFRQTMI